MCKSGLKAMWASIQLCILGILLCTVASPALVPRAWNFAFGSNMDVFTRRRRQLEPKRIVPATVYDWELRFSLPGLPYIEPAFAALCPMDGVSSHGVCLELDQKSWLRLLVSEGVLRPDEVQKLQDTPLAEILELAKRPATFGYRLLPIEAGHVMRPMALNSKGKSGQRAVLV